MEEAAVEKIRKHLDELEKGVTNKRARELHLRTFCIRRIRTVNGKRVSLYFLNDEWKERLQDPKYSLMSGRIKKALSAYLNEGSYSWYSNRFNITCPDIGSDHLKNAIVALIIVLHKWGDENGIQYFDIPMKSKSKMYEYNYWDHSCFHGFDIKINEADFDNQTLKKLAIALMGYNNIPFECKYVCETRSELPWKIEIYHHLMDFVQYTRWKLLYDALLIA